MTKSLNYYAYAIGITPHGDIDEAIAYRLRVFREQFGRPPVALWLHPSRKTDRIPPTWPPVFYSEYIARNTFGLEPGASEKNEPAQLRLI